MSNIPSPFWNKDENSDFFDEIESVCKKYGYDGYFIAFGRDIGK